MNVKKYDIKKSTNLGVKKIKILHNFLIRNFNTEYYECGDNGIISYLNGVDDNGIGYRIEIDYKKNKNKWHKNKITIIYNEKEYSYYYETISDFKKLLKNIDVCT